MCPCHQYLGFLANSSADVPDVSASKAYTVIGCVHTIKANINDIKNIIYFYHKNTSLI
jgi:hypothetical protein